MAWIPLIVLAGLVLLVIGMYNSLVRLKVQSENAWADIDVQLKRRYDLLPNLVETVKGYANVLACLGNNTNVVSCNTSICSPINQCFRAFCAFQS